MLTLSDFTYAVTTAAWCPDGDTFVTGSQDSEVALCIWNMNGDRVYLWKEENLRVHDLSLSPDGRRLAVLLETRILIYDFVTREKISDWAIDDVKLTSVNISPDSRQVLVSMNESRIHLLDIETGAFLQSYEGQRHTQFIIRSSFGGANGTHVVSGSEGTGFRSFLLFSGMLITSFRLKYLHMADEW
jgi:WD repeat-containing protein 26